MSHETARERFERFERWTDLPLAFLALLIVPALILEESAQSVHLRTLAVEGGQNEHIKTVYDALWWAIVTTTTVGYGDVSPVTPEGRLIAVGLMIVGIGFIGIFTATVTSFFFQQERSADVVEMQQRLDR